MPIPLWGTAVLRRDIRTNKITTSRGCVTGVEIDGYVSKCEARRVVAEIENN